MKSTVEKCLDMTSLFEAEVLVRLMLWRWKHPFADDEEYASGLLENASGILRGASQGEPFVEGVPPTDLNFIAAVWYAERCAIESGGDDMDTAETIKARKAWLSAVRRALPSCFCDPSDLHQA